MFLPIAFFCGSPTCQLSKCLTTILQPLTDKSRRKLQSTEDFINATKTVKIPDDYKLVSFYVKSLFTSIPFQLELQCTEIAIWKFTDPLPLSTENIMDLLNLCLASTYFQYNGKHYKQLHGTAMGSPVSVVVTPFRLADKWYCFGNATLTTHSPPYDTTKSTHSNTTLTDKHWHTVYQRGRRKW